jgi:ribosomal-protein-serine acetyltransferase
LDLGDGAEIRALEPSDAPHIFRVVDADRARLRLWMPWVDGTKSPDDSRAFIESSRASGAALDALGIFVDGAYVGGIGIRVDALNRDGEIGYWIAAPYEGRGLVTRACAALIDHAFRELQLHRVTIRVAPGNVRSRSIPERLGFTEEGREREAGRTDGSGYQDLLVYGLLDREWRT